MGNGSDDPIQAALKALGESGTKYVPERDLIAAKKGLEDRLSTVQADLATARSELDNKHQEVLRVQAALSGAEGKLSDQTKVAEEVKALKQQLQEATKSRDEVHSTLAVLRRMSIHQASNIPMAELGKKTPEQLDSLEEALRLVKPGSDKGRQSFDGGTGGGGGTTPARGRDLIKAGLADKER